MRRQHRFASAAPRRGAVVVLALFLLIAFLGLAALALDVGFLLIARTELQRSADAAATAAAWELAREVGHQPQRVQDTAMDFARANRVGHQALSLDRNVANDLDGEIVIGHLPYPWQASLQAGGSGSNAVLVRVRRTSARNGEVPLFFARIFGMQGSAVEATATAAFVSDIRGFKPPEEPGKLPLLPFTLDVARWNELLNGDGGDQWTWDEETQKVKPGSDRVLETVLFPNETGSPGNYGIVDLGSNNTHPQHLAAQIVEGVGADDLDFHGGELRLNSQGELPLSGNPGMKAGVIRGPLTAIIGQPRVIPLYREVHGGGNPATYTIVGFAGIRIVHVQLTGPNKRVVIQPATVIVRGAIPSAEGEDRSSYVYSPVRLVQ